jgi:catechol 2,3-dioxygenase-like lactoylglutathione lyase family enzyme
MIDHFGINCSDYPKSQQFYDRVLGVLGYSRQADFGGRFTTPRSSWAPSRCTRRGCGPNTTPATSAPSSATPTATMSKPSVTRRVAEYGRS